MNLIKDGLISGPTTIELKPGESLTLRNVTIEGDLTIAPAETKLTVTNCQSV